MVTNGGPLANCCRAFGSSPRIVVICAYCSAGNLLNLNCLLSFEAVRASSH